MRSTAAHGTGIAEARQLLAPSGRTPARSRYADWAGASRIIAPAPPTRSAASSSRLHGEGEAAAAPADALCTALQILNHLQDLRRDREALDRIYLPVPWMERRRGRGRVLRARQRQPAGGAVLDAALDRVDALIDVARALPCRVRDPRLRMQCAATMRSRPA